MTVILELSPDAEARLRTNAALHGKEIADYLLTLAENDAPSDLTEFNGMADFQASVAGIREGLADLDAGRSISLEEMATDLEARAEERRRRRAAAPKVAA